MKIMCRFPLKVFLVKARQLQEEYNAAALTHDTPMETVEINERWACEFLAEYRLSQRMPNRKFKAARWVLAKRLEAYWISLYRIRMFCLLV